MLADLLLSDSYGSKAASDWSRPQGEFTDWVSVALGTLDSPFTPQ
jgi:hypothetical protein